MNAGSELPRWNLGPVYSSFDAAEYAHDKALLAERSAALLSLLASPFPEDPAELAAALESVVVVLCDALDISENLQAYAQAVYTTDTRDARALAEINELEEVSLPLGKAIVVFRRVLGEREALVQALSSCFPALEPHAFFLLESLDYARRQMPTDLEDLANDLSRSGGEAWSRLHGALSSTASAVWDEKTGERKTATALRNLAFHPDRALREKAYRAELAAWKAVEIPMAAALNGVKGFGWTLDSRRGWDSALDKAVFQARVSRASLDAMLGAMEESLPLFRRYLKAKARLLGIPACGFFDLFAPAGSADASWSYGRARDFIVERFSGFDPAFGAFARRAFDASWIDAEPREGKVGGAYCTSFPVKGDSRILCNFEGSFSSVTTLAHELGHAWHHETIKDLGRTRTSYPMPLAETASIFSETIVFESALSDAPARERLGLIEGNVQDACQIVVDILSRFRFERALFERRSKAELAPEELCALMVQAQHSTYGDGLDQELLHPWMWAVKGHYYNPGLAFYNFPYAFGLLFSLGLYSRYRSEGPSFAGTYRDLLRDTGSMSAAELARKAGFDIENADFWRGGLAVVASRAEEFERLVAQKEDK